MDVSVNQMVCDELSKMELQSAAFEVPMELIHELYRRNIANHSHLTVPQVLRLTSTQVVLLSPSAN